MSVVPIAKSTAAIVLSGGEPFSEGARDVVPVLVPSFSSAIL